MLLSSHSDTFAGIKDFFFLNTYHKIMQVEWRIKVFLEFTSMKSRIYSCITLKYSAAITWMSNLGDTREFIHQDLLVKGTQLLHMYLWSQLKYHYSSFKVTEEEWSDLLKLPKSGKCQNWEENPWPTFSRWVIVLDAHINCLKCIHFQKPPSYKNEALLRCHKLTTEKIKLTEALVIFKLQCPKLTDIRLKAED